MIEQQVEATIRCLDLYTAENLLPAPAQIRVGLVEVQIAGSLDVSGGTPGIASLARGYTDVIEGDGSHTPKAGPCVRFDCLDQFARLRVRMDGCLTGSQLAKDRAAEALTKVMIPEALDYPR